MIFKNKIYKHCLQLLNEKIALMQAALHDLRQGTENDSKSSAGDKHETARAMMQIEHEKISRQFDEVLAQKLILDKIDCEKQTPHVSIGSLVKTDKGFLFLSVALGKINVDDATVIVLSPQSPLGHKLIGLHLNDVTEINGVRYAIESID